MQRLNSCSLLLEKVSKPKNMSNERFVGYKDSVMKQIELFEQDGWDEGAIIAYITYINEYVDGTLEELHLVNQQSFLVGSKLYLRMFENSQLSDKEKVLVVIAQLGGILDDWGDLKLSPVAHYTFSSSLKPGALFLDCYSKAVQRAYPNGLTVARADQQLTKTALKKKYAEETKIHQFRNQLDKHNIEYIEKYKEKYGLKTDEQSIKAILHNNWFYADPQYHNRACLGHDIQTKDCQKNVRTLTNKGLIKKVRKRGFYRKILSVDYHSEFIVDEKGQLLSQWKEQACEARELAIANGETFNYGERPSMDQRRTHDKLDGKPPKYFDTNERNSIKRNWISPSDNWFYQLIRRMAEFGVRYRKKE